MAKYKCSVCGYIYDEEKEGQPLLDSKCPVCGMTMVLMEENDSEAAASTALEAAAAPEELAYDPAYARCDASCRYMDDIHEMAVTGKSIIGAMGTQMPMPGWDDSSTPSCCGETSGIRRRSTTMTRSIRRL